MALSRPCRDFFSLISLEWKVWRIFDRDELEFGPLQIGRAQLNLEVSTSYDNYLKGKSKEDKRFLYPVLNEYRKALQQPANIVNTNPYFYEDSKWVYKA